MKVKVVPALRERGLRRECGAGPQVSETINSMERKADTMKTYLLRAPKAVEPQKPARPPAAQDVSAPPQSALPRPDRVDPGTLALPGDDHLGSRLQ